MKKEVRSLTEEDLKKLEELAELQYSLNELACIMEVDSNEFRKEFHRPDSPIADAVNRGRLLQVGCVRSAIFKAANDGSSPAQAQALEMFRKREEQDAS